MNAAHTPGKLVVRGGFSLYAEDGKTPVADTCINASVASYDEGNARRLTACWNAFDGMQIDSIEELAGFGMGVARLIVHADDLRKERDTLRAEHAALMEFVRASMGIDSMLKDHEASAEDEQRAVARYDAALPVVQALAYPGMYRSPVAIPAEAAAIGSALDCASLEQGEPA